MADDDFRGGRGVASRESDGLASRITGIESKIGDDPAVPFPIVPSYIVAEVPVATAAGVIYVSDEIGGGVIAFADGTNWRRCTDRAIVS